MKRKYYLLSAFIILATGQAIGQSKIKDGSITGTSSLPNANAVLEVETNKRGFLLPRIALTSTTAASPLLAHIAGMVVYNTATAGDVTPGYFFNDGAKWVKLAATAGTSSGPQNTTGGPLITISNGTGATLTAMSVQVDTTALKTLIANNLKNSPIKDSLTTIITNQITGGAITGQNLTNSNGIIVTGGTGTSLKATSLRLDSTAVARMMGQSPVKDSTIKVITTGSGRDSIIKSVTSSTIFKDSLTSIITAGAITGQNLTNSNGIIVTGGTGTSLKATSLRLDSTAVARMMGQSPVKDSTIKVMTTGSGRDSIIKSVTSSTIFKDSLTSIITAGAITGQNLTNSNGIIVTGGTGTSLKATSLRLDSTAVARMMGQSPVKDSTIKVITTGSGRDSIIKSVTSSTIFKDSLTSIITAGAITGQNLTNSNGIIVTGGTGTSLKATSLRLDSTAVARMMGQSPVKDSTIKVITTGSGRDSVIKSVTSSTVFKDSLTSIITAGAITGQNLTNSNGIIVTGGTGTSLKATSLRLDSTAVARMMGQSPVKDSTIKVITTGSGRDSVIKSVTSSTIFKDSLTSIITAGAITGQNLTAGSLLQTTGTPIGATLKAAGYQVDTTALKTFVNARTANTLTNPTNTITSTVNGVAATTSAVNTVSNAFNTTSRALTTTVNGVAGTAVTIPHGPDSTTASNGATLTGKDVRLGGALTAATSITTTATNTLAITGLQSGVAADSIITADASGVLRRRTRTDVLGTAASKWTNDATNTRVALTNLSDGVTARPAGTELVVNDAGRVGISTTAPAASLHVAGSPAVATSMDGIIAPRLTGNQLQAKTYTAAQTGAKVYVTAAATTPAGQTINVTKAGEYVYDGTAWQPFRGSIWTDNTLTGGTDLTYNDTAGTPEVANFLTISKQSGSQNTFTIRRRHLATATGAFSAVSNSLNVATTIEAGNTQNFSGTPASFVSTFAHRGTGTISSSPSAGSFLAENINGTISNLNAADFLVRNQNNVTNMSVAILNATNSDNVSSTLFGTRSTIFNEASGSVTNLIASEIRTANSGTVSSRIVNLNLNTVPIGATASFPKIPLFAFINMENTIQNKNVNVHGIRMGEISASDSVYGISIDNITSLDAGVTPYAIKTALGVVSFGDKVGINTATPAASLDVVGSPSVSTSLDGIIAPRLTGNQLKAKTYTAAQTGAKVYVTAATTTPAGQTINVTKEGEYVFDGSVWQPFRGSIWTDNTLTGGTNLVYTDTLGTTSSNTITLNKQNATAAGINHRRRFLGTATGTNSSTNNGINTLLSIETGNAQNFTGARIVGFESAFNHRGTGSISNDAGGGLFTAESFAGSGTIGTMYGGKFSTIVRTTTGDAFGTVTQANNGAAGVVTNVIGADVSVTNSGTISGKMATINLSVTPVSILATHPTIPVFAHIDIENTQQNKNTNVYGIRMGTFSASDDVSAIEIGNVTSLSSSVTPYAIKTGTGVVSFGDRVEVNGVVKVGDAGSVTPVAGMIRYNTTTNKFQGYVGGGTPGWVDLH